MRAIAHHKVLAGLLLLLMAASADAREWRVELDLAASEVTFEVGATLHTVHGTARLREGWLELDPESGSASGRIAIDTTSLSTAHEGRDAKMHSEVLESETYPEMVFEPRSMSGELPVAGEGRVTLEGMFTIHGAEHLLAIEVVVRVDAGQLQVETEFEVPYVIWGLKDPSRFVLRVAKQVRVRIEGAGRLTPTAAQEPEG